MARTSRGRLVRRDALQIAGEESLGLPKIVGLLEPQPQAGAIPTELAETERHLRSDGRLAGQDAMKCLTRDSELPGRLRHGEPQSRQHVFAEDFAGMDGGRLNRTPNGVFLRHYTHLVILLEINADGVAILPFKGHAPGTVHVEAVSDRLPLKPVEVEARHVEVGQGGLIVAMYLSGSFSVGAWYTGVTLLLFAGIGGAIVYAR